MPGRDILERDLDVRGFALTNLRTATLPSDAVRFDQIGGAYTFTDGLTLVGAVVHGDYITGKAGDQVWNGGLNPGDGLTINASLNAAKGPIRLNTRQFDVDLTQSIAQTDTTTLDAFRIRGSTVTFTADQNINGATRVAYVFIGQPTFDGTAFNDDITPSTDHVSTVFIEGPPLLPGWDDKESQFSLYVKTGDVSFGSNSFFLGSIFASASISQTIAKLGSGDLSITNGNGNLFLGASGLTPAIRIPTTGNVGVWVTPGAANRFRVNASQTVTSGGSVTLDAIYFDPSTITVSGATPITTAAGFNFVTFAAPTYNGTPTITNAATVTILGAPGGTDPITNPYAFWVQAGNVRIASLNGMLKGTTGVIGTASAGSDFVAPTTTLTAGAGLTGGGDLSANRTFDVIANADGSIVVNANDIQVGVISDAQHGTRAGGTLHAAATTSTAGFLSAADKSTLANSTFVVRSSTNAPASAQNLGVLGNGILKHTVTAGLSTIAVASAGTDFESTLTFSQGVTRVSNAITGDYVTGKAGGQTWTSGTSASDPLTLQTFATTPTGTMTLGAGTVNLSTAGSASAPTISFGPVANKNGFAGYSGCLVIIAGGTQVGFATTTQLQMAVQMVFSSGSTSAPSVEMGGNGGIYPVVGGVSVVGGAGSPYTDLLKVTKSATPYVFSASAAAGNSTASTEFVAFNVNMSRTATWATGAITTQREVLFQAPTYAFAGASIITTAATVAITGAPIAGTNATISNPLSFWVQGGNERHDVGGETIPAVGRNYFDIAPISTPSGGGVTIDHLYTTRIRQQTFANSGASNSVSSTVASLYIDGAPLFTGVWSTTFGAAAINVAAGSTLLGGDLVCYQGLVSIFNVQSSNYALTAICTVYVPQPPRTIVSATNALFNSFEVFGGSNDVVITGSNPILTPAGFNYFVVLPPNFSNATSNIIADTATVYIGGPPTISGGGSITRAYSLWIDSGLLRYDGLISPGGGAAATNATIGGSGPTTPAASGWLKINSDGNTRFVQVWT